MPTREEVWMCTPLLQLAEAELRSRGFQPELAERIAEAMDLSQIVFDDRNSAKRAVTSYLERNPSVALMRGELASQALSGGSPGAASARPPIVPQTIPTAGKQRVNPVAELRKRINYPI